MASTQIYLQKMFADMQTALSGVQTDIAGLVAKMDQQIAATGETVDAIGQIATEMTITSVGADRQKNLRSAGLFLTTNTLTALTGSVICKCDGTLTFSAVISNNNANATPINLNYTKNGGAVTAMGLGPFSVPANSPGALATSTAFSVVKGDVLIFYGTAQSASRLTVSNVNLHYAMHNLITDSPFIL